MPLTVCPIPILSTRPFQTALFQLFQPTPFTDFIDSAAGPVYTRPRFLPRRSLAEIGRHCLRDVGQGYGLRTASSRVLQIESPGHLSESRAAEELRLNRAASGGFLRNQES